MTVHSFSEATHREKQAMLRTAADPKITNPRATELREQIISDVAEKMRELTPAQLREAVEGTQLAPGRTSPFWKIAQGV